MMLALEEIALPRTQSKILIRYVEETFVTIKSSDIGKARAKFKNIFNRIKLIVKVESETNLRFLDVHLSRTHTNGPGAKLPQQPCQI